MDENTRVNEERRLRAVLPPVDHYHQLTNLFAKEKETDFESHQPFESTDRIFKKYFGKSERWQKNVI